MIYYINENSDFLMHHGIKGQSWGVQNGPPYPLDPAKDYSPKEQKANFKILKKEYKRINGDKEGLIYSSKSSEFKENVSKKVSKILKDDDMEKLRDAKSEMARASKASLEFEDYEDKLRHKSSKKAFDECYDWFKKNDPNGLNEMMKVVKENVKGGGSKYDLVDVHGFRKAYEGYEDYQWSKDEKIWKNDPKYKELKEKSKSFDKAYNKYLKVCDDISDKLLGQYGNYPYASKKFNMVYNGTITYNYKDLMSEVLSSHQFSDLIIK